MAPDAPPEAVTAPPDVPGWVRWGVPAFLLVLAVWRWTTAGAPGGGDWALYMSHARALLEGRPYADTGYLFSEIIWVIGPPTYPPGTALSIAPLLALFGESTLAPRLLMHALLALFVFAAFRYFAPYDRMAAWAAALLLGTSFLLNDTANVVGSDLGLCAFSWAVLCLADAQERWGRGRTVAICLLGLAALSYRIAAAPLVGAVLIWGALRAKRVGWAPWVTGIVWGAAFLTILIGFGGGSEVAESVSAEAMGASDGEGGNPVLAIVAWLADRIEPKVLSYRFAFTQAFLFPFPWKLANHAYHLSAFVMALWGMRRWLRAEWKRFGAWFIVLTVGMLAVAPVWVPRYAWVLLPFVLFGFTSAAARLETALRLRGGAGVPTVVLAAVIAVAAVLGHTVRTTPPSVADEDWRAAGAAVAASESDQDVRVGSNRPRVFSWFTRIPAAGLPDRDLRTFLSEARRLGLTHVVVTRAPRDEAQPHRFDQWRREHPDVFERVSEHGLLEVYRLRFGSVEPEPGP